MPRWRELVYDCTYLVYCSGSNQPLHVFGHPFPFPQEAIIEASIPLALEYLAWAAENSATQVIEHRIDSKTWKSRQNPASRCEYVVAR